MENIIVTQISKNEAVLKFNKYDFEAKCFLGENGTTINKKEGDKKTPLGEFELGICFGTHQKEDVLNCSYIELNENLYWVDDCNSKYYNKMVDISKVRKDWTSAEHLIEYTKEYEYAIEIKVNPKNIPNKGSAIFIHCSSGKPTAGCIAIGREKMEELVKLISSKTNIKINFQLSNHNYVQPYL